MNLYDAISKIKKITLPSSFKWGIKVAFHKQGYFLVPRVKKVKIKILAYCHCNSIYKLDFFIFSIWCYSFNTTGLDGHLLLLLSMLFSCNNKMWCRCPKPKRYSFLSQNEKFFPLNTRVRQSGVLSFSKWLPLLSFFWQQSWKICCQLGGPDGVELEEKIDRNFLPFRKKLKPPYLVI